MYLLDTNNFIEAYRRFYAMDIAPGFWRWLEKGFKSGQLGSIAAVRKELLNSSDSLAVWVRAHKQYFFEEDEATVQQFARLSKWASSQNYRQSAIDEFLAAADYRLVAAAAAHNDIVVTFEQPSPESRKRIKIPDACAAFGIEVADLFSVMRKTGAILN